MILLATAISWAIVYAVRGVRKLRNVDKTRPVEYDATDEAGA